MTLKTEHLFDTQQAQLTVPSVDAMSGEMVLPGSKSISNRCFLLAALANGVTQLQGMLVADDTRYMAEALRQLGVDCEQVNPTTWRVQGCGGVFPNRSADLFLGNAGTAVRTLTAALSLSDGDYKLGGIDRMHERPIGDLVDAMRQLGASIEYLGNDGYPPLAFTGSTEPRPEKVTVSINGNVSSQFLTGLLQAAPLHGGDVTIDIVGELISKPYVAITIALMKQFGVVVDRDGWSRFYVAGKQHYQSVENMQIEGDASSASYFMAAGAIGCGPVTVRGLGQNALQGDVKFAEVLAYIGAHVEFNENSVTVSRDPELQLKAFDLDFNHIPDAAMSMAIVALHCDGPCYLRNIGSWRVKETDRIDAMANELKKLGADIESGEDWLKAGPVTKLNSDVAIDTYDDHRIAMCFSLASLSGVAVKINEPSCVNKTFPEYFQCFQQLMA